MDTTFSFLPIRRFGSLVKNDIRHIFRDPVLTAILVMPLLTLWFLRSGMPWAEEVFPLIMDYRPLVLAAFCLMDAAFAAFLISFILLEEKDQQLLTVLRVMPVSPAFFLLGRTAFLMGVAFAFSLIKILFSGSMNLPPGSAVFLSLSVAATAPLLTLAVAIFAQNKIEGMTWFKGLNAFLLLPILAFFIAAPWKYLLGLLPMYWTYQAFASAGESGMFWVYGAIGMAFHALLIAGLIRMWRRVI